MNVLFRRSLLLALAVVTIASVSAEDSFAQANGENLGYQGLVGSDIQGARALGMGGAYMAISGELDALFINPAGLAGLNGPAFTLSTRSVERTQWENQRWSDLGNRRATLSLLLGGLYVPKAEDSGKSNHEIQIDPADLRDPALATGPFDTAAADWEERTGGLGKVALNYAAAAWPISMGSHDVTLALAYARRPVSSFDRNDTFLDPHIGSNDSRVYVDSLNVNWGRFQRTRSGSLHDIAGAVAYAYKSVRAGARVERLSGGSDDHQMLDRIGRITFPDVSADGGGSQPNLYVFTYDTLAIDVAGTSRFSSTKVTFGGAYSSEHFSIGATASLPSTVERDWSYTRSVADAVSTISVDSAGVDRLNLPATYGIGVSVRPVEVVVLAFDMELRPFGKTTRETASGEEDAGWANQEIMRFGASYNALKPLWLSVGYRIIPQAFIPQGAAFDDRGPEAYGLSAGVRYELPLGVIDLAFERRRLQYFDVYATNTNYAWEVSHRFVAGYTLTF